MVVAVLIVVAASLAILVYTLYQSNFANREKVERRGREAVVLENLIHREVRVVRGGVHYKSPDERVLQRVDLNRDPISLSSSEHDNKARAADGIEVELLGRYDIIVGREYDQVNGTLRDPDHPDEEGNIKDEHIIEAVTRIDFGNKKKHVAQIVSVIMERETRRYLFQHMLNPAAASGGRVAVRVPQAQPGQAPDFNHEEHVTTSAAFDEKLSEAVEFLVNYELRYVGLNVIGFEISNIRPTDDALQKTVEEKERKRRAKEAADQITDLPKTVAYAVGTDQLGLASLGEGIRTAGEKIGGGLQNFGRG